VSKRERPVSVIFVVDDEEMIAKSLALILSREGFDVSCFTNPLEAMERMETVAPDLLISDVMMPQLSGIDLAIHTRKSRPGCRILLFSAAASELLRKGRLDFRLLQKPLHPNELLVEIEKLGETPPEYVDGRLASSAQ
jgi:DNA-binding response OmpR family regulator